MNKRLLFLNGLLAVCAGAHVGEVSAQPSEASRATLSRGLREAVEAAGESGTVNLTEVCRSYLVRANYGEAPDAHDRVAAPGRANRDSPDPTESDRGPRRREVSEIIVSLEKPSPLPLSAEDVRRFRRLGFVPVRAHPDGYFIVFEYMGHSIDEVPAKNIRALTAIPRVAHIETNCRYPLPVLALKGLTTPDTAAESLLLPCVESQCDTDRQGPGLPNDMLFRKGKLWGLDSIAIVKPWLAGMTGVDDEIKVAIIDSGVNYEHPDLQDNMWINVKESELPNGKDDDQNGIIDDRYGAVFIKENCEPGGQTCDRDPQDATGHGTFVASIIGAMGDNNEGRVGVAWSVKMVPVRVGNATFGFDKADLALAIDYAAKLGPRTIANISMNIHTDDSQAVLNAIQRGDNLLIVAAAGDYADTYERWPVYPAAFEESNIVSVSSIVPPADCEDPNARRAWNSSFDRVGVDIHAPGSAICGICGPSNYCRLNGTSNAAPHLAGGAALIWSQDMFSNMTPVQLKDLLIDESCPSTYLKDKSRSEGTLNLTFLGQ